MSERPPGMVRLVVTVNLGMNEWAWYSDWLDPIIADLLFSYLAADPHLTIAKARQERAEDVM